MSQRIHFAVGWVLVIGTLLGVGFWVPPEVEGIGSSYLIFFFHFPSAVNCLNMFLIGGGLALAYLITRRASLDLWSASSIEVGVLATTITLATGMLWAKPAWGIWWDPSDPRLMSVAIMWLIYLGYLALRLSFAEGRRALFCSVFAVLAALNVPVVLFSIRVLGAEHHPMAVEMGETSMIVTRWFGALAFFVLYTAFWRLRHSILVANDRLDELEQKFGEAGI